MRIVSPVHVPVWRVYVMTDTLSFKVEGTAKFMGMASGNPMGLDSFTDETHFMEKL